MNTWQARREARAEQFRQYADNARSRSESRFATADRMASCIPMGQPILVGHHSEKSDRRFRDRIHNNMMRGVEESQKAKYWEQRAAAAESNTAIFKQDPEAVVKLQEKITELEKLQERMKAANKAIRKGDNEALEKLGYSQADIAGLKTPDFCGRIGYPGYALTNNSANIRRLKIRLDQIQSERSREEVEETTNGVIVRENADFGSTEIIFPGKPSPEVIAKLKLYGFRWCPSVKLWSKRRRDEFTLKIAREIAGGAA